MDMVGKGVCGYGGVRVEKGVCGCGGVRVGKGVCVDMVEGVDMVV